MQTATQANTLAPDREQIETKIYARTRQQLWSALTALEVSELQVLCRKYRVGVGELHETIAAKKKLVDEDETCPTCGQHLRETDPVEVCPDCGRAMN